MYKEIEHSNIQINKNKSGPAVLKYLNSVDEKYKSKWEKIKQVKNSIFELEKENCFMNCLKKKK